MSFLCNLICFQPKYYNKNYIKISNKIKKEIEAFINNLKNSSSKENDIELLRLLIKLLEIVDNDFNLRKNLIRFRNELELYKSKSENNAMSETRVKIVELTIQTVGLLHYGTLLCTNKEKFEQACVEIKNEFQTFKDWIKSTDLPDMTYVDKYFLLILYKFPKLMKVKRGFNQIVDYSSLNRAYEEEN